MGEVSVAAGLAALTVIGVCAWSLHGSGTADAAARTGASGLSVFGTIHPPLIGYGDAALEPDAPRVRLASLEPTFDSRFAATADSADRSARPGATFEDRFGAGGPARSIVVKTVSVAPATTGTINVSPQPASTAVTPARATRLTAAIPLPRPAPRSAAQPAPARYRVASLTDTTLPSSAYAPAESDTPKETNPLASDPAHTAIYDIAAHTVYLPGGQRLEAHSGLGDYMDDVRAVQLKKRGPTPPNVYDLTLRESLFHGVQAIRLNPVAGSKMYGRDGMLVHPFMLGPKGDSNGCVSLKDYSAFLKAYQRGEITRLVVVEQLDDPPGGRTAGEWFSSTFKKIFGSS
jgi:hypothetical protein